MNLYSRGDSHFQIKLHEIDPDCRFLDGNAGAGVDHFNLAFRLLYQGQQNIRRCTHPKLKMRLAAQMKTDISDGYDDMIDACDHVFERINDKIKWEDSWGTTYGSFAGFTIPQTRTSGANHVPAAHRNWPDPIWNFRKAVESRLKMQKFATQDLFMPNVAKIVDGFDKSAFHGMSAFLAKWRKDVDQLDKFGWILDPSAEEVFKFKTAKRRLSYTSALSDLEGILDTAAKYRDADFSNKTSLAFAALTKAVELVPVFGTFYGRMLSPLPGFFETFRTAFKSRLRRQLNP